MRIAIHPIVLRGYLVFAASLGMVWKDGYNADEAHAGFTVVTKNVLANEWVWPEYYPYSGPSLLSWSRRFPAQVQEITGYDADILTLQEIDRLSPELTEETFQNGRPHAELEGFWGPSLEGLGYAFQFKEQNPKHIGVLAAHKTGRWAEVASGSFDLSHATAHLNNVNANQAVYSVLKDQKYPGMGIIICTTHLYFASSAVRGHQAIVLLEQLAAVREAHPGLPVLLTGDFNMRPEDASRKLILGSPEVQEEAFWDQLQEPTVTPRQTIGANPAFSWVDAKASFKPTGSLFTMAAHDLFSDCQLATTHRTATFDAILDYSFVIPAVNGLGLQLAAYKPLPEDSEVMPMPNELESSDHFALFGYLVYTGM